MAWYSAVNIFNRHLSTAAKPCHSSRMQITFSIERNWEPARIWTWAFWTLARCSYQLSHWSSGTGAKDRWHLSLDTIRLTGWILTLASIKVHCAATSELGNSSSHSLYMLPEPPIYRGRLEMFLLPKKSHTKCLCQPKAEMLKVLQYSPWKIQPLSQTTMDKCHLVGKSLYPSSEDPRFESWLDLNASF